MELRTERKAEPTAEPAAGPRADRGAKQMEQSEARSQWREAGGGTDGVELTPELSTAPCKFYFNHALQP